MRAKTLIIVLIMVVVVAVPNNVAIAADDEQSLINQPRYLQTDKYGYYACYTNQLQQYTSKGWKLVLDLGNKTTAYNSANGDSINDWRSFYITDLTYGYIGSGDQYGRILVSGLVMIPSRTSDTVGRLADVFLMYYPNSGHTQTLHINIRYPMQISKEQHDMIKPFEYLDSNVLFPRGIISNNGSGDVFVLSGAADLDYIQSENKAMLEAKGYNGDFFEIVRLRSGRIFSEFHGPLSIFTQESNSNFRTPEFDGMKHNIDRRLIVFRTDDYEAFAIASIGTDDSDFCTAIAINIKTQPEDEYYWIRRDEFLRLAGMTGVTAGSFGMTWTEKDMDSYIDK